MRILVVEDSPPTRDLLQRSLEENGHVVTLAARYATGLRLAGEGEFDVAIVDVTLPDGDGLSLCRDLRARGITWPILFLTARGEVHLAQHEHEAPLHLLVERERPVGPQPRLQGVPQPQRDVGILGGVGGRGSIGT